MPSPPLCIARLYAIAWMQPGWKKNGLYKYIYTENERIEYKKGDNSLQFRRISPNSKNYYNIIFFCFFVVS